MHTKQLMLIGAAITFILATLLWWINFGGDFSTRQQDWASFGTYVGGVVSPVIASLSLFAFLKTLDKQQEQIRQAQNHVDLIQIESAIEKLESDYKEALSTYPISIDIEGKPSFEKNGYFILSQPSGTIWQALPTKEELENELLAGVEFFSKPEILLSIFGRAAGELNQIQTYIESHSKKSGGNILAKYYYRKYKLHHDRLLEKGYMKEEWLPPR